MDTRVSAMLLTAATFFAIAATLAVPHAAAQVGTSSLQGIACIAQDVQYIRAPGPGEQACQRSLPNATLRLSKPGPLGNSVGAYDKTVTTDAKGAYSFTQLSDGDYSLNVSHRGFDAVGIAQKIAGSTSRDVALQPQVLTVSGHVIGPKGEAVKDAQISSCCTGAPPVRTASDGSFKLSVTAGWQYFNVNDAPGYQDSSGEERFIDGSQAQTFTLARVPPQDATIAGTVLDQHGNPLANVRIDLSTYGGGPYPYGAPECMSCSGKAMPVYYGGQNHTVSDAKGRYVIHLNGGGQGSLSVNMPGYAPFYATLQVGVGQTVTQDVTLLKYPAKTAHIEGQVPEGVSFSVSMRSPAYGIYECSDGQGGPAPQPVPMGKMESTPASGDASAPDAQDGADGSSGSASAGSATASPGTASMVYPGYSNACAIHLHSDGSFEGDVTPGYTIIEIYPQGDCSIDNCQAKYYSWAQTLDLAADQTTAIKVDLRARPGPDAVVSGYLIDSATGKGISGAQVSFSALDGYGYGTATTDEDGSYGIKLHSGPHQVNIYTKGYFSWEGTIDVNVGDNAFDVKLTAGQDANGGCCVMYAAQEGGSGTAPAMAADSGKTSASTQTASQTGGAKNLAAGATSYEDLHGGLGPYDASKRTNADGSASAKSTPAPAIAFLVAALGLAAVRRRA